MMERMTLLADLEAFVHDHRSHGGLTGDATEPASNDYPLTVTCACGVVFERWITPADADGGPHSSGVTELSHRRGRRCGPSSTVVNGSD